MSAVWILLLAAVVAAAFAYVDREPRKPKLPPPAERRGPHREEEGAVTAEERAKRLCWNDPEGRADCDHSGSGVACEKCIASAICSAEDDALERAAHEVAEGFVLVPRDMPWHQRRRVLSDHVRALKSGRTPGGGER